MNGKKYNISMQTPIGRKQGTITVTTSDVTIKGSLDVLGHSEPFEGVIDADGICSIKGKIVTLLRTVHYTATGRIDEKEVRLRVEAVKNTFEVIGEAVR